MNSSEMIQTSPISVQKSARNDELRTITSFRGGQIIPVAFIPLLREDRVSRGSVRLSFEMLETLRPLLNAVNVMAHAHFVSPMCFARFADLGLDSLNRSYQGIAEPYNSQVIPYFNMLPFSKTAEVWKKMGVHWPNNTLINFTPVEAYNCIVNFRRRSRSDRLPLRAEGDANTLAEGFWKNTNFSHIVPDFDQAAIGGEVELSYVPGSQMFVSGFGQLQGAPNAPTLTNVTANEAFTNTGGVPGGRTRVFPYATDPADPVNDLVIETMSNGTPKIFVEMQNAGVTVSLANIELAKQTAAFAKLRDKFDGIDDEHIIDLLMEGIRVPDAALKQPLLLDRKSTIFGMTERHAMDGASLDQSVTTGKTELALTFRTPPMNTGGVIMITVEAVPEQLYERQYDTFLGASDPATLPNFMRDYLDPEKVEVVQNSYPDVLHDTPTATFGYAPLNHGWKRSLTRAGGKFYRPDPTTFVEDRQRFWSADQENPTLSNDFYMVSDLPHSVFADTTADPFEVVALGNVAIVGNTVFGDGLEEDAGSYDEVMSQVPDTPITITPVP